LVIVGHVDPEFSLLKVYLLKEINAIRTHSPWALHTARAKWCAQLDFTQPRPLRRDRL